MIAIPRASTGRHRVLGAAVAIAVILAANAWDDRCELPDPRGPDGWRTNISERSAR